MKFLFILISVSGLGGYLLFSKNMNKDESLNPPINKPVETAESIPSADGKPTSSSSRATASQNGGGQPYKIASTGSNRSNAQTTLDRLNQQSSQRWEIKKENGKLVQLTEGRLKLDGHSPEELAYNFLLNYGDIVSNNTNSKTEKISVEHESSQVILQQQYNSLPRFNSRLNMIFNDNSELIFLSNDYHVANQATPFNMTESDAIRIIFNASSANAKNISTLSQEIEAGIKKGYIQTGKTAYAIYQAKFFLETSSSSLDVLAEVDATSGQISKYSILNKR